MTPLEKFKSDAADFLSSPLDFLSKLWKSIEDYVRKLGLVLGIVAGVFALMVLAPLIEVAIFGIKICLGLTKIILRHWKSSAERISSSVFFGHLQDTFMTKSHKRWDKIARYKRMV